MQVFPCSYFPKLNAKALFNMITLGYLKGKSKDNMAQAKISQYATIHEKIAILQCLFGFATADGTAHQQELSAIRQIASWCGVDSLTYEAIKMMYVSFSSSDPYGSSGGGYSGGYGGRYSIRQPSELLLRSYRCFL